MLLRGGTPARDSLRAVEPRWDGTREVRFGHLCPRQLCAAEIGPSKVASAQVGAAEIGSAQVTAAQVDVLQIHRAQVTTLKGDRKGPLQGAEAGSRPRGGPVRDEGPHSEDNND